ncbi:MAG: haloacid dehalogenase-like hydrolase [Burkholderiales bacterium]|nr:haloacid dehalogenase-like hydrolase [Burkholderiales bacterium]
MQLALFDLDYTLLPIDSDYEWARFLVRRGVLDGEHYERENDRFFKQYKDGSLDIFEFLAFQLAPLASHPRATLDAWHQAYMDEVILPRITPAARDLVVARAGRGQGARRERGSGSAASVADANYANAATPIGRTWSDFERSWFYSDSRNDLPLLEQVTHPVATNPDAVLKATAIERGWPVLNLFEGAA